MAASVPVVVRDLGPDVLRAEVLWAADLHVGNELHDAEGWRNLRQWLKGGEHRYCILGGDLMEAATRESKSDIYSAKLPPQKEMEQLAEDLGPHKDQILLVLGGNHEERIWRQSGVDPLAWVCRMAGDIPYARDGGFVVLRLGRNNEHGRQDPCRRAYTYVLYANHGWSAGRRPGSTANALQELSMAVVADVYLIGHAHRAMAFPEGRVYVDPNSTTVQERSIMFVACGSLLHYGGYVQRKGRVSGTDRMPVLTFDGKRRGVTVML